MTNRGAAAEQLAADYLTAQGLRIVARNYRVRGGEVDLICEHGPELVFVEVRLRTSARFGGAAASIGTAKQQRLILAARHYLLANRRHADERPCRFDAVLLDDLDAARIDWIRGAFDAD